MIHSTSLMMKNAADFISVFFRSLFWIPLLMLVSLALYCVVCSVSALHCDVMNMSLASRI